jgi:hypothetical protein
MAREVRGVVIEIETYETQENLDTVLEDLAISVDDFLAATTISMEEKNNRAKVLILYAVTIGGGA